MTSFEVKKLPGYRAIGLKWEGAYADIPHLKDVIYKMSERRKEFTNPLNPEIQLGLSYHLRPDGFTHYSAYEVDEDEKIPYGMVEIYIPEYTYLITHHEKGENIGKTYMEIATWIKKNHYNVDLEENQIYFDALPIKHERYPRNRDLLDPHFEIWIPIQKNSHNKID